MELAMIGLGRMGGDMVRRLLRGGHQVVGYDRDPQAVRAVVDAGALPAESLAHLADQLRSPRVVWMMLPAGSAVDDTIAGVLPGLEPGDVLVDGGNSNYRDTLRRAAALRERALRLVDVGTSGGIWGLQGGYCLMVGGETHVVEQLRPALETLAPAPNLGWGHVGPVGTGHFVKMVHNGVEYALMEAYAEGFAILKRKDDFQLDVAQVAEIWRHGSVIRSWLLDLTAGVLAANPGLAGVAPYVADTGEGRWTVREAVELGLSTPAIALALLERLRSQDSESFGPRLLAALRREFGGHEVKAE
jgi:6-phosphogluconate dehydrogenase